jgi:hypothetical protein
LFSEPAEKTIAPSQPPECFTEELSGLKNFPTAGMRIIVANYHFSRNNFEKAEEFYSGVFNGCEEAATDEQKADANIGLGVIYWRRSKRQVSQNGHFDTAETFFDSVLENDGAVSSQRVRAFNSLSKMYWDRGIKGKNEDHLVKALQLTYRMAAIRDLSNEEKTHAFHRIGCIYIYP